MVGVVSVFRWALFATLVLSLPIVSFAHSGGTDKHGCHAGTEPYHCHNGGDSSGNSSGTDVAIAVGVAVIVVGAIWYVSQRDNEEQLHRWNHQEVSTQGWAPTITVSGSESAQTTSVALRYRF